MDPSHPITFLPGTAVLIAIHIRYSVWTGINDVAVVSLRSGTTIGASTTIKVEANGTTGVPDQVIASGVLAYDGPLSALDNVFGLPGLSSSDDASVQLEILTLS